MRGYCTSFDWTRLIYSLSLLASSLHHFLNVGIKPGARLLWEKRKALLKKARELPVAPLPPPKLHKFKYRLPKLLSYKGEEVPNYFWNLWTKLPLAAAVAGNSSWIIYGRLLEAASKRGAAIDTRMLRACSVLKDGADIGCVGRGRLPTRVRNSDVVLEHGDIICDVLQDWIVQGIAAGPCTLEELENVFGKDFTINKMTTRPKPTGALRIIIDMSAPRDVDDSVPGWIWNPEMPGSVNSSVDPDMFPTRMSSLKIFVRMLYRVGKGCVVFKVDWKDAYKHIKVRHDDLKLQVIEYAGRYFVELKLVFGAKSSPGIYDEISQIILDLAILQSSIDRTLVTKHLDDTLGVGMNRPDDPVFACFKAYLEVAEEVGVRLPPPNVDKDKVQSPHTTVTALGMEFDTVAWQVRCPELKVGRILHLVRRGLAVGWLTAEEVASLAGQLVDKVFLLPGARFNIGEITRLVVRDGEEVDKVEINDFAREQLRWWFVHLPASAWFCPIRHPEEKLWPPAGAIPLNSDAAGGSLVNIKVGLGVISDSWEWCYFPWPMWLKEGKCGSTGVPLTAQLQLLELCGPLVGLATWANLLRNKAVVFYTDNQSAVFCWERGYSRKDRLSSTVVKAVYDLGLHLNVQPYIKKVARCSTRESVAADRLSQGAFEEFFKCAPEAPVSPSRIPPTLVRWLSWPVVDYDLGKKIAFELKSNGLDLLL